MDPKKRLEETEYHKGQFCVYRPVLCQEGYCTDCAIYYQSRYGNQWLDIVIGVSVLPFKGKTAVGKGNKRYQLIKS